MRPFLQAVGSAILAQTQWASPVTPSSSCRSERGRGVTLALGLGDWVMTPPTCPDPTVRGYRNFPTYRHLGVRADEEGHLPL